MIDDLVRLYLVRTARATPHPPHAAAGSSSPLSPEGGSSHKEGHMRIFGREPALWLTLIQTAVALAVGLGLAVSGEQVGLINAAAAAVLALVAAVAVRPFPVPLLMGAIQALIALGVGFGLELSGEQVGLVNAAAAGLVGFILRMHVSPAPPSAGSGGPGVHAGRDLADL